GGGAFQPIAQSIMLESFPREKQGMAMGVYGIGVVIAPIIGPVLGGWITDNYSWRWIFFIKVPAGFLALWLGCQEVLLDKGQEDDWFGSRFIFLMAVLAVVGLIVFIVRERSTD